jgi:hypothetical protein
MRAEVEHLVNGFDFPAIVMSVGAPVFEAVPNRIVDRGVHWLH